MKNLKKIYLSAGILTIILYIIGIFTGVFVQKSVLSSTEEELKKIMEEINSYRRNLENIQLENMYLTLNQGELSCSFLISAINKIQGDLSYFWERLPKKLEVYEKYSQIEPEYESLKKDYMLVSLRAWLIASSIREKCGKDIIPTLYFYSKECDSCIEQGNVLDKIRVEDKRFTVFTIDLNLEEPIVSIIKDAYNITEAPSLIIADKAYKGFANETQIKKIISSI